MKRATGMETCAKIFFVYLQPSVNKNSWNFAQFWLYNLMTSLWSPGGRDFEAPDLERGVHFRGVF